MTPAVCMQCSLFVPLTHKAHCWLLLLLCMCVVLPSPQVVRVEPSNGTHPSSGSSAPSSAPCVLLPEPEAIPDAPDWAKPNRSWVQQFVADFQQLRRQVQQAYEEQGGLGLVAHAC